MSNPWLTIWTQPKATIRSIVAKNPNRNLWWLASIYGFCSLLNLFQSMMMGFALSTGAILIISILLSPIWGYVNFSIWSWFVSWTGKWFKGKGSFKEIRSAYAWSCVPIAINVPLWVLMVIVFGHQLFLNFSGGELVGGYVTLLFFILIAKVILAVWSLIIYFNALAEVQKYSVLRAIINLVVAGIIVMILCGLLWGAVYSLSGVKAA